MSLSASIYIFLSHFFFSSYVDLRDLHSFPTRRSSDLAPRPRAVQTSAEVLTPAARSLIERTLGGRCFDRYGCREVGDRKSTRLNSSHTVISYAVFCLKKKKLTQSRNQRNHQSERYRQR